MSSPPRAGRPRASSRATLAEAACELFLEQGFAETTVADITRRAGVSRSSFFNYFASKSAVLWAGLDERIARTEAVVAGAETVEDLVRAFAAIADDFAPDSLALAIVNADVMGIAVDLADDAALRSGRLARAAAPVLARTAGDRLVGDILAAGWAGAVMASIWAWAGEGAGRSTLGSHLDRAIEVVMHPPRTGQVDPLP